MTDKFILESFWQKGHNCAFVAFVKVGIMRFGLSGLLGFQKQGKQFHIILRNGRKYRLSIEEVKLLNQMNKVAFRRGRTAEEKAFMKQIRERVRICFAVVVEKMTSTGYEGKKYSIAEAVTALNDEGMKTTYFHSLLGLKRTASIDLREQDINRLRTRKAILLFTERHIVAASKGLFDRYGRAVRMNGELPLLLKEKVAAYYTLK